MLILAFDTTAAACSVALWRDGKVERNAREVMEQGQAEALMPMIERVMRESTVDYMALDRIAVTTGPGSFTGVRVGLATARGLALAANKPLIGITSAEALAAAVQDDEMATAARIVVAIDTKRGDLYAQQFDASRHPIDDIVAIAPSGLSAWVGTQAVVVIGDATRDAIAVLGANATASRASAMPNPELIARLAAARPITEGGPLPLYIHPPATTVST